MAEGCNVRIWHRRIHFTVLDVSFRDELERIVENLRIVHNGPIGRRSSSHQGWDTEVGCAPVVLKDDSRLRDEITLVLVVFSVAMCYTCMSKAVVSGMNASESYGENCTPYREERPCTID